MPLSKEDLKDLDECRKTLKLELAKVKDTPVKFAYVKKFAFKNKKAPLLVVGQQNVALLKDVQGKVDAAGECVANDPAVVEFKATLGTIRSKDLEEATRTAGRPAILAGEVFKRPLDRDEGVDLPRLGQMEDDFKQPRNEEDEVELPRFEPKASKSEYMTDEVNEQETAPPTTPLLPPQLPFDQQPFNKADGPLVKLVKKLLTQAKSSGKPPADEETKKLYATQSQACQALVGVMNMANVTNGAVKKACDALASANAALIPSAGLTATPLREDYKGENEKKGWRVDKPVAPQRQPQQTDEEFAAAQSNYATELEDWKKKEADPSKVTRYVIDAQERFESELTTDADKGTVDNVNFPKGHLNRPLDYVVDPKTGQMYVNPHTGYPKQRVTVKDPITGESKEIDQIQTPHHSTPLAGADVAGAGEIIVDESKITKINNKSGHYRPDVTKLMQTVELLLQQGALLDKHLVAIGADGKGRELSPKEKALFDATLKADQEVQKLKPRIKFLTQQLQNKKNQVQEAITTLEASGDVAERKRTEDEWNQFQDKIRNELSPLQATLQSRQKQVRDAVTLMDKLGMGPSNKIRPVTVEVLGKEMDDMTGHEVKQSKGNVTDAETLLKSGGIYTGKKGRQADLKAAVLAKLRERTSKTAAGLDSAANDLAKKVAARAPVTEDDMDKALKDMAEAK